MTDIYKNLQQIRQRIFQASQRCGRQADNIEIVAVAKSATPEQVDEAIRCGIKIIGENRVQEAVQKRPRVARTASWHMVGHLQTNKVRKALQLFDLIHSVDSLHLAEKLQIECEKQQRLVEILVQINTSGEESKFGIHPKDAYTFVREIAGFPCVRVQGLMTIGAFVEDEATIRDCFRMLRRLSLEFAAAKLNNVRMQYLSMGMSNDFEIAVEEGANLLRLGRAIFGPRVNR